MSQRVSGPTRYSGSTMRFCAPVRFRIFCESALPRRHPIQGGSEKEWIKQYSQARHNWLANHSQQLLRNTAFRPQSWLNLIAQDNWNLDKLPIAIIDRPKVNYA